VIAAALWPKLARRLHNGTNKGSVRVAYELLETTPGSQHERVIPMSLDEVEGFGVGEAVIVTAGGTAENKALVTGTLSEDGRHSVRIVEIEFTDGTRWPEKGLP
jgi:hypothetical protein